MAYPTVSAPYGLKPVRLIGGQPYAGATSQYPVLSTEGTAIYTGDVVTLGASGNVTKLAATDTATLIVGVFMGCSYTSATTGQKVFAQYAPATPPSDCVAYVADDPDLVFKAAVCSSGTTMGGVTQVAVGATGTLILNAGSTATGNSKFAVNQTVNTTNNIVKIVGVVPETVNASGSSTEVLVIFPATVHFMRSAGGV